MNPLNCIECPAMRFCAEKGTEVGLENCKKAFKEYAYETKKKFEGLSLSEINALLTAMEVKAR